MYALKVWIEILEIETNYFQASNKEPYLKKKPEYYGSDICITTK